MMPTGQRGASAAKARLCQTAPQLQSGAQPGQTQPPQVGPCPQSSCCPCCGRPCKYLALSIQASCMAGSFSTQSSVSSPCRSGGVWRTAPFIASTSQRRAIQCLGTWEQAPCRKSPRESGSGCSCSLASERLHHSWILAKCTCSGTAAKLPQCVKVHLHMSRRTMAQHRFHLMFKQASVGFTSHAT